MRAALAVECCWREKQMPFFFLGLPAFEDPFTIQLCNKGTATVINKQGGGMKKKRR